jgi:formyltetrahydrofolate deformylase
MAADTMTLHRPESAPKAAKPAQTLYILTLSCPDRIGINAAVADFLLEHDCNIVESAQFNDPENAMFFIRVAFTPLKGVGLEALEKDFAPIAARYAAKADFYDAAAKVKTLVLVSALGHCLNDIIFRHEIGALPIEIVGVASNHTKYQRLTESAGLSFDYLPITPETKPEQEAAMQRLAEERGAELIVLARYMQVLSDDMCRKWSGRIINIHHSFLPSFKGAMPYHRAHARGVKLIGATAHYVTADLDEGPIIEQAVHPVRHSMTPEDFVAAGRDVEAQVLARAIKWHAERRILMSGQRTVIFQ